MTEKQIEAAFAAYGKKFGRLMLTMVGMSETEREAAASACAAAVKRGSALSLEEIEALEPKRKETVVF